MERERESSKAAKRARTSVVGGGRKELMEQEEVLPSSSSSPSSSPPPDYSGMSYSIRQCRICHEEEDALCAAMESPCACSGSVKYAHRGCVQRWCDEKGSTVCEICLQNFESGYTAPPKKAPVVEMAVTVSEEEDDEEASELVQSDDQGTRDAGSDGPDHASSWCRSLTITFTIMLLVWHLVAVVTIEAAAADHCAFSLLTVYLLRASGIMLPFYAVMRLIRMVQHGQRQYRLQLLQERRRNASDLNSTHGQEQLQLVVSIH